MNDKGVKHMDLMEAISARHSVRQYETKALTAEQVAALQSETDVCNREGGLHIQLVTNEPKAFNSLMAHYGKFSGVTNYFVLIGKKGPDLEEKCGYYGERLVLLSQQLGLNTCWVAMTYKKVPSAFQVKSGEKLTVVIALGCGKTQGAAHKSKPLSDVAFYDGEMPDWFEKGMEAALLAPTAMNQQKFKIYGVGDQVTARAGKGFYSKVDLGIVKYHFEIGAGKEKFLWTAER